MGLMKSRVWPYWQIGVLKWTSILIGMLIGATWSGFVKNFAWIILALAVLGSAQVIVFYFSKEK